MKYRCMRCGCMFEDGEEYRWQEDYGEFMSGCPECHGDYEECIPCEICGSYHIEDGLIGGVCKECIDEYRHDAEACFRIGQSIDKEAVSINSFLAEIFTPLDIERILLKWIDDNKPDIDCSKFVDMDIWWFANHLAWMAEQEKEVKK